MIARRMPVLPNDEVERRGALLTSNEADLSQSSIPPWLAEYATPRSLEPIVRAHRYGARASFARLAETTVYLAP
jgi:hypothetical protein